MKLRYYLDKEDQGLVILEADPQMRRLLIYSQSSNTKYVPLPYVYFTIRYKKSAKGFTYLGLYGAGLQVHGSIEPLKSFKDNVINLPTDYSNRGLVCTDHSYDNKEFDTISELVNCVVGIWYGLVHNVDYNAFDRWLA